MRLPYSKEILTVFEYKRHFLSTMSSAEDQRLITEMVTSITEDDIADMLSPIPSREPETTLPPVPLTDTEIVQSLRTALGHLGTTRDTDAISSLRESAEQQQQFSTRFDMISVEFPTRIEQMENLQQNLIQVVHDQQAKIDSLEKAIRDSQVDHASQINVLIQKIACLSDRLGKLEDHQPNQHLCHCGNSPTFVLACQHYTCASCTPS